MIVLNISLDCESIRRLEVLTHNISTLTFVELIVPIRVVSDILFQFPSTRINILQNENPIIVLHLLHSSSRCLRPSYTNTSAQRRFHFNPKQPSIRVAAILKHN